MKKIIFTLLLAIVSSVWTMSRAICMVEGTHLDGPIVSISGEIIRTAMPCGDEEPCADCLTLALSANEDIYYFSTTDPVVEKQLDSIYSVLISVNCICEQPAIVKGVLYTRGSFHYIAISSITILGDIQPKNEDLRLNSLCDEWNVLEISSVTCGYCEEYRTYNFHLTTDTVIGGLLYSQLIKDGAYKGALREGNNRDIYCVPAGCSQEYLLYAFNAQVGDSLKNIWVGGYSSWIPDVRSAIVSEIKQTTPRTIELEVHYYEAPDAYEESIRNLTWIEGIGMPFGPMGAECSVFNGCADSKAKLLLCAYKNGEQVYVSEEGKKYGCEYNGEEQPRLKSLCDEWNVWYESFESYGPINFNQVVKYQLTTDTIINEIRYVKLVSNNDYPYCGALREGDNRDIYYIPVDSSHEYLLYAFNAKVGDMLTNLYIGGFGEESGHSGVVESISDDSPRVFTIRVNTPADGIESGDTYLVRWIEGVGSPETPCGMAVVPYVPTDIGVYTLLCAYNNGEQVYISEAGQKYGCEYNGEEQPRLKSLCDEWNVLEFRSHMGFAPNEYYTRYYHLTTDTIITEQRYIRLYKDNSYMGAMREGDNRDIYYIPAYTTHEYLLYAFNAQIGDQLTDLWLGITTDQVFTKEYFPYGVIATVEEIAETTPRRFVLSVGYITTEEGVENYPYYFEWIEGVGFESAPDGATNPLPYAGGFISHLLCAYKNNEQVYTSEMGQKYGCEYNGEEVSSDTIPLYVKDNPGSSTVDPADPNLIYAVLEGDMLIIKDFTGAEIIFTLTNNGSLHSPARARRTQSQTFTDSTSVKLMENGLYDIELTSEAWDYMVFGSFDFNKIHEAVERIQEERPAASKIFRNGQLLIRHGDQLYTPSGVQVQ